MSLEAFRTIGAGALALQILAATGLFGSTGCGDSGGGGAGGGGGSGASPDQEINGCTRATAEDHTGEATVNLAWALPHQSCIVIDTGTTVVWTGTFASHPIADGEPDSGPEDGPLTSADGTDGTVEVTYASPGVNPYFCETHLSSMQGVVYVE